MTPLAGMPLVTAADMRAAEAEAIAAGATVEGLMATAGLEIASAVRRLAGPNEVLVLCGPGNNGGDGYVAAAHLQRWGLPVRVAALADPVTGAARHAREGWSGPVEALAGTRPTAVLVDAVFGTGLSRPLDHTLADAISRLNGSAQLSIAVDLPSGVGTDDGALLGATGVFDVTLALGGAKPAHVLYPAAQCCGAVHVLDIGVPLTSRMTVMTAPDVPPPGPDDHKYTRGMVAVIGGDMPGAAALASIAALRCGVGYALLLSDHGIHVPHAVVTKQFSVEAIQDRRLGALVVGPGLGRGNEAGGRLDLALGSAHPLVIDGDALHLLDRDRLATIAARAAAVVLTPHAGEFAALFGAGGGSKIDRARAAAAASGAMIVFKGPDTVVAAPDGQASVLSRSNPWLSTAGTGDVLAGAIGAMLAAKAGSAFGAACAGVWFHAKAAAGLKGAFIADDLAHALSAVRGAA